MVGFRQGISAGIGSQMANMGGGRSDNTVQEKGRLAGQLDVPYYILCRPTDIKPELDDFRLHGSLHALRPEGRVRQIMEVM